ncbi:coiled-coil domain-containing protein 60 isoform X2 [Hemicordylus capensis]|uniref:coiled-coil domain-containing protein 60 isoform X2 n=1 Tax=Hemicordylus capensis TaxID=884348 RepID=UPI002302FE29|nr:coiled-coil domain-containing protein 60 isoform X2 [Hemicordylus capensis]
MPVNPKTDPRYFVVIQPLPIPTQQGRKVQARCSTVYNCWDSTRQQVFLQNYRRRTRQLTQQGYFTPGCKPYQDFADPLYLEPKKVTLFGLGQLPPEVTREDVPVVEEVVEQVETVSARKTPPKQKEPEKKPLPLRHLEKDLKTLHRDLAHTRHLIHSVKIGRGYFHMLQRETLEREHALRLEQWKEEQREKTEFQPPTYPSSSSSDEDSSDEDLSNFFLTECPLMRETEKKKKKKIVRPFTPVHNGLPAPKHPEGHFESLFRQLCALHWLLEALTLEPSSSMKPVITCWSAKDYGGGRSSMKVVNRERTVKTRWEHFLLHTKGRRYTPKSFRGPSSRKMPKKPSAVSESRTSGLSSPHSKTTLASTSSLTPGSDEAQPPSDSAKDAEEMESLHSRQTRETKEEEEPLSYYLQTLLQMIHEDVAKNFSKENMFWSTKPTYSHSLSTRSDPDSDVSFGHKGKSSASSSKDDRTSTGAMREDTPVEQKPKTPLAVTLREDKTTTATYKDEESTAQFGQPQSFITQKQKMCNETREIFYDIAQESAFRLHDQLDIMERRREEKSVQKYMSLKRLTRYRRDLERMRQSVLGTEPEQDAESENWFSTLLARIPDDIRRDHRTQKVLKKLERFARNPDLRIRPPTFLKILGELRTWELCSPDICAAVQFVREHIVQMPEEDYREWLQARVPIPKRARSAPPLY